MKELTYCSHSDPNAAALSLNRNSELPMKNVNGSEIPYDKVLHSMRNQEMMFYSNRIRSGY